MNQRQYLKNCYITVAILLTLLVVFLIEVMQGGSENAYVLVKMGSMNNLAVVGQNQWWRLFTAQFLHIGIMHLASNAVMIYYIGTYIEPLLGHWRFLLLYLSAGVGGNLLSLALGSDSSLSAGASTALFGLFGAMTAVAVKNRANPVISYLGKQAFWLAVINIVLDLFSPNIDIQGHIGGLAVGFLIAIILGDRTTHHYSVKERVVAAAVLIVYCVATVRMGMVIKLS